jgi:hypothetical protein
MNGEAGSAPLPPVEPTPDECCGSGCARCVFDLHDEAVQRYREALAKWQVLHQGDSKASGNL